MSDLPGQTTGTGAPPGYESGQQQPQPPVVQPGTYPSGPRAGFWRRFIALVLDGFVIAIPAIVLFLVFDAAIAYVLTLVGYAAYYIVLQGGPTGQTIGKKVFDIRVVDINTGGPIGNGRSAVRFLVQFFLSGILYLGYLWMLWDKEKQTWHDHASTSVVVPTSAYPIP